MKIVVDVDFKTIKNDDMDTLQIVSTRSRVHNVLNQSELLKMLQKIIDDITTDIEVRSIKGSGFTIIGIQQLTIHYSKFTPARGAKYIDLPDWIKNKKGCVNIKNDDNKCFKYSIQCQIYDI